MVSNRVKLISSIGICLCIGFLGGLAGSARNNSWFDALNKPSFNPPPWIFAPVWTFLYILMGISMWMVWKSDSTSRPQALILFSIQLALNFLWSIFFFRLHSPLIALLDILLLDFVVFATIRSFFQISKAASYLLLPYAAWLCFATVLNYAFLHLNEYR